MPALVWEGYASLDGEPRKNPEGTRYRIPRFAKFGGNEYSGFAFQPLQTRQKLLIVTPGCSPAEALGGSPAREGPVPGRPLANHAIQGGGRQHVHGKIVN